SRSATPMTSHIILLIRHLYKNAAKMSLLSKNRECVEAAQKNATAASHVEEHSLHHLDEKCVHDLRLRLERIALAKFFRREHLSEMEKLTIAAVRQRQKLKCALFNDPLERGHKK
uniref:Uncharacterized protein n=1 Tax=Parascaris univalens TaxID=6257 RepID=A0A915C543_PARUN